MEMYLRHVFCALLLSLLLTSFGLAQEPAPANPQPATPMPPGWVNVKDFGAMGDGKADDTKAVQAALDSRAYKNQQNPLEIGGGVVYFPPGHYRITQSIQIAPKHSKVILCGGGGVGSFGADPLSETKRISRAVSELCWDGEQDGVLIDVWGTGGIQMRDVGLNGNNKKARVLLRINSPKGHGSGGYTFERMVFASADTGIECGGDSYINSADMSFIDMNFANLGTGFRTMSEQNVDFLFIRLHAITCNLVLHFQKGGNAEGNSLFAINCPEIVRIDSGGINAGTFFFSNMRIDVNNTKVNPDDKTAPRSIILRAKGETNVKFSALDVICGNSFTDTTTPAFILGPTANVSVESSMITGFVAELTGNPKSVPTWIQFDNCRFRVNADPRKIKHDDYSGFELRNCLFTADGINADKDNPHASGLIPHFAKYPKQIVAEPAAPAEPVPAAPVVGAP